MKTLLVYGTRYGATKSTSEEIAKVLQTEGLDVQVVNAQKEKVKDISPYELVIVGSGIQMGRWVGEIADFVKKFHDQLTSKKLAVFVSSMKSVPEKEGKTKDLETARKYDLDDKITKYDLHPISIGFFGGVINFNKMNIITRKTFGSIRGQLEKDGFKQTEPGVYELRDWEEIRGWAKELATQVRQ